MIVLHETYGGTGAAFPEVAGLASSPTTLRETRHFRLYQDFVIDPDETIAEALRDDTNSLC